MVSYKIEMSMGFISNLEQLLIRLFIRPFSNNDTVDFKETLRNAKHVLIVWPCGEELRSNQVVIESFSRLFPHASCITVHRDCGTNNRTTEDVGKFIKPSMISFANKNVHLWSIIRSEHFKELRERHFDVLIDVDPVFNLLSAYLCRVLNPRIRIGFSKPYSLKFYNLLYNGMLSSEYSKRLHGLHRFIKSFLV
jgi:hypothetical protein